MNPNTQTIFCSNLKCRRALVFFENGQSVLNYNFVKRGDEYVWPRNQTPFARGTKNRETMKALSDQWKGLEVAAAEKGLEEPTRADRARFGPVLKMLGQTHHGDFKPLQIDLASLATLVCKCGARRTISREGAL